jgi:hypothetical protein
MPKLTVLSVEHMVVELTYAEWAAFKQEYARLMQHEDELEFPVLRSIRTTIPTRDER